MAVELQGYRIDLLFHCFGTDEYDAVKRLQRFLATPYAMTRVRFVVQGEDDAEKVFAPNGKEYPHSREYHRLHMTTDGKEGEPDGDAKAKEAEGA